MLVGGLAAAVFGFIVGLPALRLKGDYLAIVTLAFGEIVRNLCMNMPFLGGALGLKNQHTYGKDLFVIAFIAVIVMLIVIQNLVRSKHGRAITAVRDNAIAAKAMGINVTFYKLFAFTLAAFFAGVAGVIYGASTTPVEYGFFSYDYSIEILVMVVLGGIGSINGSILAAMFLTYVNITLMANLPGNLSALRYLVYAIVLIIVILFNNAPAFTTLRDRYSPARLRERIIARHRAKVGASVSDEDSAEWDRVPTKIPMDEMLSIDLSVRPDAPDRSMPKGGKENH
jgi:branched-chain amino acid transport system permease protein